MTSYPWTIYPVCWWQAQTVSLGPNGRYDFYFYAYPGQRFDFSTCPEDGGSGSFDTVIEVYDPFGSQVGYADDNCGVQSRISLETATEGSYRVSVRGYFPFSYGPFSLVYRLRGFEESALLVTGVVDQSRCRRGHDDRGPATPGRTTWSAPRSPTSPTRSGC